MTADDVEWRYLPQRATAHCLRHSYDEGLGGPALCGARPFWSGDWRGTGSQNEYEQAARLPRCKRCVSILNGGKR
jgi:hypothetical protein